MENAWNWEQKTLINELIQGMELAKQLKVHLSSTSSAEIRERLVQRILASYEKALLILNWSGSMGQHQPVAATASVPESPMSTNGSPRSEDFDGVHKDIQDHNDASKKRKIMPKWTEQVRISSENGLEGPHDDGYSWRKYGQKDILGARYPRSYYRCTYRNTKSCWATKQVQRSDEDPTIFEVTYRGRHTCSHGPPSIPPPASPEKQEQKQNIHKHNHTNNNNNQQRQQSQEILLNFRNGLRVNTVDLDKKEVAPTFCFPSTSFGCMKSENHSFFTSFLDNNVVFESFSPSFISPATPESNYYSPSPCQMNNFGGVHQHLDSDLNEIISANTSATNSPNMNLDFSLDPVEIDPNFPFDSPGFFS